MASTAARAGPPAAGSSHRTARDEVGDGRHGVALGGRVQERGGQARRTARGGADRRAHQGVRTVGAHTAQHEQHRAQGVVAAGCQAGAGADELADAGVHDVAGAGQRGAEHGGGPEGEARAGGAGRVGGGAGGTAAAVASCSARLASRCAGTVPGRG